MANVTKNIVESISVQVPPQKSQSQPSSSSSKRCCSVEFLLQNYANFSRSAAPARLMYYENGSWLEFSSQPLQNARSGFLEQKPIIEVSINGSNHYLDFMRMLDIDIMNARQRSIAWIDENGKCFFPKTFIGVEKDVMEKSENS